VSRKNLLINPSFRSSTEGWEALADATIEISDDYGFYGSNSLKLTRSALVGTGLRSSVPVPVQSGLPYSASIYVFVPITIPATSSAPLELTITWLDSQSEVVGEDTSIVITKTPSQSWSRLTLSVASAPVGATFAYVSLLQVVSGVAGDPLYIDAALFEQSAFVGEYLDNLTQAQENEFVNRALTKVPTPQITGMELNSDISLGSLILNTIDEDGVVWVCTNITGWWEQPNSEMPDITRGTDDGSYQVSGRYTARYMTLEGVFLPQDKSQISSARDKLTAATNLVRRGEWLRANEEPTRASFVRLTGQPTMETVNARGRTQFSVGLVAPDPVKYQWNDNDPENGLFELEGAEGESIVVRNIGTADVKCILAIRGPIGSGSTILNASNNEVLKISEPLRGRGPVGRITSIQRFQNVATATTEKDHQLSPGDKVEIFNVISPFNSSTENPFYTVLTSNNEEPYQFTYSLPGNDISELNVAGVVALVDPDVLEIDTYNQSVLFNEDESGQRFRLSTLVDWIALTPGNNTLVLTESQDPYKIETKQYDSSTGLASISLDRPHFIQNDGNKTIDVFLPETASVIAKKVDAVGPQQIATLTTDASHGYAAGDVIDINLIETIGVVNKSVLLNEATIITDGNHGIDEGEEFNVEMATSAQIITKTRQSNVVTLRTSENHRFFSGDLIDVSLPTEAQISRKSLFANVATLTTRNTHNFSIGDTITVSLPETAVVTNKTILGSTITLTTNQPHGFSLQDKITVNLNTTASITNFAFSGTTSHTVTLTTSGAHNFSVGDRIVVNIENVDIGPIFNGSWVINSIPSSTQVRYLFYLSPTAVSSTALTGTNTITNTTNQFVNGLTTIVSIPSASSFTYFRET
jgi:hypothetical protein